MSSPFEFDHSHLSLLMLQKAGIRSTREIEEIFIQEWYCDESHPWDESMSVYIAIGFTLFSKPLKVAFTIDKNAKIITLAARLASVKEIKEDFCKYCK